MLSILLGVELRVEVLGNQTARLTSKVAESFTPPELYENLNFSTS